MRSIKLNASDIAAFIGRHPFRPQRDAVLKIVKTLSPNAYAAEVLRDPDERTEAAAGHVKVRATCAAAVICKIEDALSKNVETAPTSADAAVDRAQAASDAIAEAPDLTDRQKLALQNECRSSLFCKYGTVTEDGAAEIIAARTGAAVHKDDILRWKCIVEDFHIGGGIGRCNVILQGKADGVTKRDGRRILIEIKNRAKRLFGTVPDYERIQVACYMFLNNIRRAKLVERFGKDMQEHDVPYDAAYFDDILTGISAALGEVADIIEEHAGDDGDDDGNDEKKLINCREGPMISM